jgi:hypothetical protein
MQNADAILDIYHHWRAGCLESVQVRFGEGRLEKDRLRQGSCREAEDPPRHLAGRLLYPTDAFA